MHLDFDFESFCMSCIGYRGYHASMKTPLGIAIVKSGSTSSGFDYYFDTKIRLMVLMHMSVVVHVHT